VYADKTGAEPRTIDDATQEAFDLGHIFEPSIIRAFARVQGRQAIHVDPPQTWFHADHPFIGASLDAYSVDAGGHESVVEAKTIMHDWEEWLDGPPVKHWVQVQHQLACTGWLRGWLVGWDGRKLHVHEIERDEKFIGDLITLLKWFWQRHVEPRVPPPIDDTRATAAALARIYPRDTGTIIEVGGEVDGWLARRRELDERIGQLEAEKREIENRMKAEIQDASYAVTPSGKAVSWKIQRRKSYTVKESEFRVLRELDRLPKTAIGLPVVRRENLLGGEKCRLDTLPE
jgi:predicted phage-related endonuclease